MPSKLLENKCCENHVFIRVAYGLLWWNIFYVLIKNKTQDVQIHP